MAQPRVAVIGGGIAGTLCSLVLKNRGIHPILIDNGRNGLGGRLRGVQFLRAADPRLATVFALLEREGLIAEWKGRFGLLGSSQGGFLRAEIVSRHTGIGRGGGPMGMQQQKQQQTQHGSSDTGDFCHFVDGSSFPTYIEVPSATNLCSRICELAGIEEINESKLMAATPVKEGGWKLNVHHTSGNASIDPAEKFDALVLATHDPSLASGAIRSIVDAEVSASGYTSTEDAIKNTADDASMVIGRLTEIADSLQRVRDDDRMPVFALNFTFPQGFSSVIPFDAVSIPGSQLVQFLANNGSKPGGGDNEETWTAITTSKLASSILARPGLSDEEILAQVLNTVTNEVSQLVASYHNGKVPKPLHVSVKRWGSAFCARGLELREDSIFLAPWRLTICGDFIRLSEHTTPLEAAALSGLEAGERTAALWSGPEN